MGARRARSRWLFYPAAILLGLVVGGAGCLAALEAALRLRPELFSRRLQTLAFSKYDALPGGIYVRDVELRMNFMRSAWETRMGFNGYWWTHRTDERGFRNPPGAASSDLVLLGDSLIYGHGLDEERTVAHLLRAEHGRGAYNMARQGDGLYHHYVLARLYLEELAPRTVVAFVFLNDLRDVEKVRTPVELATRPEAGAWDTRAVRERVEALQGTRPSGPRAAWYGLHVSRVLRGWTRRLGPRLADVELVPAAEAAPRDGRRGQPFLDTVLDPSRRRPVADYYRRTLSDLDRLCRELGARLVLVNLHLEKKRRPPRHRRAQAELRELVASIAGPASIPQLDTGELFAGCQRCYLPHDGHLSETGHRRLAAFLAARLPPPRPDRGPRR